MMKKILLALLAIAVLGAGYLWLKKDSIVEEFNRERAEDAVVYREAGLEFGRTHDQQECLDEALQEFDTQCTGFSCTVRYGKFLNACLETASDSATFCDNVPAYQDEKTEEEKVWARETCWDRDIRGEGCRVLLRQQQYFCTNNPSQQARLTDSTAAGE
ncbi:hypothetical protein [Marinobacterium mangrovicola]|uniref:Uncharacterized protein n=1 Tax=Marinobacterium mangrovicola TaxID=1476959 RepID=A0A4R1G6X5_9GAMM|nr:hypothetical protein [Marinobacterium mangrovicola]TCK03514.1 hypothetical protein CLV83_3784 [Marinobacterium mangrovicola]